MKQEITELTEKIDQCNLNLQTAHDDIEAKVKANIKLQEFLNTVRLLSILRGTYIHVSMH